MGYLRYYFVALLLSVSAFLTLFFLFFWSIRCESSALLSWQVVEDRAGVLSGQGESLQKFYVILKTPTTILLRTKIDGNAQVPEHLRKSKYLYISQADCSYLRVYVNSQFIGSVGLHEKRTGHFWYQPFLFELPSDTEEITIVMSGIYGLGIDFGAFLVDERGAKRFNLIFRLCVSDTWIFVFWHGEEACL
ncbi:hypothetical protein [Fervidobacterium thailandense]|uniref:Uncharacterized protein n=1 Tax=Fervidobacterium thailandense TaxID=1008305 RepID=A0A1E3G1V1_9BACT|nr:hypothetical protein [Fervidobacterium thailandense]ODN29833.1 hypothetical protein A4H02_08460 [Fervidobacterium thailandense]